MTRILWRSWTPEWTEFEIKRLKSIGLNWDNGHKLRPLPEDIWLTANGQDTSHFDLVNVARTRATFYCETYQYMQEEYNAFPADKKWDYRFTYNTDLLQYPNTYHIPLPGYWAMDGKERYTADRNVTFGMVLTKKFTKLSPCDLGYIRTQFVEALRGKSFVYWGQNWDMDTRYGDFYDTPDPNWQGIYFRAFDKHFESRELLARCKFALAIDTSLVNGFVTEKFWNALAAGCLPLYYGPFSIALEVPSEVYIDGFQFDTPEEAIKYCEDMSDAEWRRRTDLGYEFFQEDYIHSWEAAFTRIDRILQE